MGAVHRLHYNRSDDASSSGFDALTNAILALGGTHPAPWSVNVAIQRPAVAEAGRGDVCVVTFSECPGQVFLVSREACTVVQAEEAVLPLLDKYKMYTQRTALLIEGLAYRVGDFRVRLGRVAQRPGDRIVGLALDASYPPLGPSAPPQETAPVLQDLGEMLQEAASGGGGGEGLQPADEGLLEGFELEPGRPWHRAAVQYVFLAAQLLKR